MSNAQAMLAEFDHESQTTRRFLERVSPDKLTWRPHPKSHTLGELALHVATVTEFVTRFALVDASPIPSESEVYRQPASAQEILTSFDKSVAAVKQILGTLDDAALMKNWSALVDGKPVMTLPKATMLRLFMLNHWIHHRGQLGVYLRLTGAKVPSSYGPSGDEG